MNYRALNHYGMYKENKFFNFHVLPSFQLSWSPQLYSGICININLFCFEIWLQFGKNKKNTWQ